MYYVHGHETGLSQQEIGIEVQLGVKGMECNKPQADKETRSLVLGKLSPQQIQLQVRGLDGEHWLKLNIKQNIEGGSELQFASCSVIEMD